MKNLVILATTLAIVFFACKKDEPQNIDDTPVPEPKVSMMPLKEGNYWVYSSCNVDTNGVDKPPYNTDSIYISGKEVIHGDTFYTIGGSNYFLFNPDMPGQNTYIRDSSGYLVDQHGVIYYSENNYTDTLGTFTEPIMPINGYTFMAYKDSSVIVPAGTFNQTATLLTTYLFPNPDYHWGPRRDAYYTYAKGVGLIKRRVFFASPPDYIEYRLLRYHVTP
jgi:hypothetical protein